MVGSLTLHRRGGQPVALARAAAAMETDAAERASSAGPSVAYALQTAGIGAFQLRVPCSF